MNTFTHKRWLSSSALIASVLLVGCQTAPVAEEEASTSVEASTAVVSETLPELNIPESIVDAVAIVPKWWPNLRKRTSIVA